MGQYHKAVNLDKKQFLSPHAMCVGAKLLEWNASRMTECLTVLLAISNGRGGGDLNSDDRLVGSWAGDRIAVVGDYWGDNPEDAVEKIPTQDKMEADGWKDISLDILKVMCEGDRWFKQELLESVASYDFGRDWSEIFTKEEISAEQQKEKSNA